MEFTALAMYYMQISSTNMSLKASVHHYRFSSSRTRSRCRCTSTRIIVRFSFRDAHYKQHLKPYHQVLRHVARGKWKEARLHDVLQAIWEDHKAGNRTRPIEEIDHERNILLIQYRKSKYAGFL